ncbi:nitrate regulatory gene2 protein-like [Argentina anserina]|uniref:nitrate regulatory gene2 protein-like n=1 Tax=Argentina anserina TaxID=57926 RepID=UPI0021767572|nr:nitrate regulatory gene2 protein-like [Potentilla anserina]XP_050363887.1 nitrate regulatory gene2 protein-like [Potentilla anserina]
MGCGSSKVDDLPLVKLCRERRDYIKTASDTRYALAAAHLTYFLSLKQIGDALCKFVDEDLVIGGESLSPPDSPVLTLPSDEGKPGKGKGKSSSSSSISLTHSLEDAEDSHLHLSDTDSDSESGHIHIESSPEAEVPSSSSSNYQPPSFVYSPNSSGNVYPPNSFGFGSSGYGYDPNQPGYGYDPNSFFGNNQNPNIGTYQNSSMYYMRRSETPAQTFYYGEPERFPVQNGPPSGYGGGGGFFGYPMGSPAAREDPYNAPRRSEPPPEPPSPPKASAGWDFFNVFDIYDNGGGYSSYFPGSKYGSRNGSSAASSPDSKEVREREGIPELEDETEQELEVLKEVRKEKKKANEDSTFHRNYNAGEGTSRNRNLQQDSGEGTSRGVPKQTSSEGSSGTVHLHSSESSLHSVHEKEIKSSPDVEVPKMFEEQVKKKRVSFEFEEASTMDIGSSKGSSLTTLSVHGTREVQEVVQEIRDEFETASSFGKEVAVLLEVGKLPYQSRVAALKVIFSRILCVVAPPSQSSIRMSSKMIKMAKGYRGEPGKDINLKSGNLSSTLEKLYAWEEKLYKEVRDEEKLRVVYEKECKRLKKLDAAGAESVKIDAAQASVRNLNTKINVCIRAVDTISRRIHKLRDEELLPQVSDLIHGLIRMWKCMLSCHQKQLQAIMESKIRSLKGNASLRKDSGLKATLELEMELLSWCTSFNNWVNAQKSYVQSLNGWLLRCISSEPEETPDGVAPFSPSRMGAPPIFVICNDWFQAMERISQQAVADAMYDFATTLHQLWDKQDVVQRQRIKAENLSKDLENQLKKLGMDRMRREHGHEALSEKSTRSKSTSESGVSALDDLKVDLDSMRQRFSEEKRRHKDAIKEANSAASNSLQMGLIPIFETLGSFTSEALKVHEQVRVQNVGGS